MKFNRIKEVLVQKQIKNKDLAESLDVSYQNVSNWVRNVRQPKISTLFRIAKALDVSPRDLLSINNPL